MRVRALTRLARVYNVGLLLLGLFGWCLLRRRLGLAADKQRLELYDTAHAPWEFSHVRHKTSLHALLQEARVIR